jgi:hypothetical protein
LWIHEENCELCKSSKSLKKTAGKQPAVFYLQMLIKADIRNPLRYLLITLKPLRGSSVGV